MKVIAGGARPALDALERRDDFIQRHIGPGEADIAAMLQALDLPSLDRLVEKAMPRAILDRTPLALGEPLTEAEMRARIAALAAENRVVKSMIGLGYYGTTTPAVIRRNVLENPGWYTAYTPYQPEISQGRLELLLAFQTMVGDLTGLDIANASMLDEATAAAEAMTLAKRVATSKSHAFFVSAACHPQTIAVIQTRAEPLGIAVIVGDPARDLDPAAVFGALVQYPDTFGAIADHATLADRLHAAGALLIAATDLLALTILKPPGEWGADVAVGSSQRFGVPLGFGGPHAGFLATKDSYKRSMPGRLVGVSVDAQGRPAYRLALQTREQHIRREKATSNICTAQVLLAVMATLYAAWHGPDGLATIARRTHRLAAILAQGLERLGLGVAQAAFFDTVAVTVPGQAEAAVARALKAGINIRRVDADTVAIAADETTNRADIEALWAACAGRAAGFTVAELDAEAGDRIPTALARNTRFLTHPIFNSHRSETEMMRFLARLEEKDIALNRSMIPLGSCTMKLNAAAEMEPVTWPAFADIHPFAPADQCRGFSALIGDLEDMLCRITGMAAVTLQPNAGSQGEYTGLLVIRAHHRQNGQAHRNICLIPSSAHGTNPASAVMAGMEVVVVACDADGNIDLEDLRRKAQAHRDTLAALMVTYPSTHGVYEDGIVDICRVVHEAGGQVYMDGANMNALVGLARPGAFGPDVLHLNLHKTFCIPHGGGGPGVGPIGVKAHLAPFLPGHPLRPDCGGSAAIGPVSAAPWGSPLILPISWSYIRLMGAAGVKRATEVAILNANYVAARLAPHFPVLYTGKNGRVAHECIIDLRPLKDWASVEDVAKRLMDFGFHAPTMSFPVAGTLMIEPTESESKAELDRFCDAMIHIREEIRAVETGRWPRDDSPLVHAPHGAADLLAAEWKHPYTRAEAAYPLPWVEGAKYWPPVGRIDNVYGDRHLVCACPPMEAYAA
ncbi:MAG: aminomethyl-transferring glycine dehydrogenase [Rhodospirillaceae bacterium]|nr:aminomethyl-transferring glycine dehydrogenase [Rhodospirillaceae bacterium]